MYESMIYIQSATAENRRRKNKIKEEDRETTQTTSRKYNVRICYAGRPWTLKVKWIVSWTCLCAFRQRQRTSRPTISRLHFAFGAMLSYIATKPVHRLQIRPTD